MSEPDAVAKLSPNASASHDGAMARLLDRPLDDEEVRAATLRVEQPLTAADSELVSLLAFRLGEELFGIPAADVVRVTHVAPLHRIPHRSNAVICGLCNVEGELLICASLAAILELRRPEPDEAVSEASASRRRMVVIGRRAESWAVIAAEVLGVMRLEAKTFLPPPVTVHKARQCFTRNLVPLADGRTLAVLDAKRLDAGFKAALT